LAAFAGNDERLYDDILFAVGNNHSGTLYPAVVSVAPELVRFAFQPGAARQQLALAILSDLVQFEPEPGFELVSLGGRQVPLLEALREGLKPLLERLRALAADDRMSGGCRACVNDVVAFVEGHKLGASLIGTD
jgi:hypothetical protein